MRAGEQTLPRPGQRALQRHICEGGVRWHPGGWRQSRLCHRHHPARRAPVMEVGRYWHAIRQTLYVIQIRSFSEACFATSDRLNRNRARNNVQSRSLPWPTLRQREQLFHCLLRVQMGPLGIGSPPASLARPARCSASATMRHLLHPRQWPRRASTATSSSSSLGSGLPTTGSPRFQDSFSADPAMLVP